MSPGNFWSLLAFLALLRGPSVYFLHFLPSWGAVQALTVLWGCLSKGRGGPCSASDHRGTGSTGFLLWELGVAGEVSAKVFPWLWGGCPPMVLPDEKCWSSPHHLSPVELSQDATLCMSRQMTTPPALVSVAWPHPTPLAGGSVKACWLQPSGLWHGHQKIPEILCSVVASSPFFRSIL